MCMHISYLSETCFNAVLGTPDFLTTGMNCFSNEINFSTNQNFIPQLHKKNCKLAANI